MPKITKCTTISIGSYRGIVGGTFKGIVVPLTEPNDDVELGFYSNNYSTYTVNRFASAPSFGLYGYTSDDIKTEPVYDITYTPTNGGHEQLITYRPTTVNYRQSPGFEAEAKYGREFFASRANLNLKQYNGIYKVCDTAHPKLGCAIIIVDIK